MKAEPQVEARSGTGRLRLGPGRAAAAGPGTARECALCPKRRLHEAHARFPPRKGKESRTWKLDWSINNLTTSTQASIVPGASDLQAYHTGMYRAEALSRPEVRRLDTMSRNAEYSKAPL